MVLVAHKLVGEHFHGAQGGDPCRHFVATVVVQGGVGGGSAPDDACFEDGASSGDVDVHPCGVGADVAGIEGAIAEEQCTGSVFGPSRIEAMVPGEGAVMQLEMRGKDLDAAGVGRGGVSCDEAIVEGGG